MRKIQLQIHQNGAKIYSPYVIDYHMQGEIKPGCFSSGKSLYFNSVHNYVKFQPISEMTYHFRYKWDGSEFRYNTLAFIYNENPNSVYNEIFLNDPGQSGYFGNAVRNNANTWIRYNCGSYPKDSTNWYEFMVCMKNNIWYQFLNGKLMYSYTAEKLGIIDTIAFAYDSNWDSFGGCIDDWFILDKALYTSSYTPKTDYWFKDNITLDDNPNIFGMK